jgi:hypothetical protein
LDLVKLFSLILFKKTGIRVSALNAVVSMVRAMSHPTLMSGRKLEKQSTKNPAATDTALMRIALPERTVVFTVAVLLSFPLRKADKYPLR